MCQDTAEGRRSLTSSFRYACSEAGPTRRESLDGSLSEQRARKSWQSTVMITSTDMQKTQRQLPRGGRVSQRAELENGDPGAADFAGRAGSENEEIRQSASPY